MPPWAWPILGIGVASRLFSSGLIIAATPEAPRWPLLTDSLTPFTAWDAQWFLHIAGSGYHAEPLFSSGHVVYHDFAFFPGWPLLVRALSVNGALEAPVVAVAAANILLVLALIPVCAVLRRAYSGATAQRATAAIAFAPPAYVGSLAYSEALFLLLGAVFFATSAPAHRPWLAAAAQLTRLPGSALSVAAGVGAIGHGVRPVAAITVLAGPAVFLGWCAFVWMLTGDPLGYLRGSPSWYAEAQPVGIAGVVSALVPASPYSLVAASFVLAVLIGALLLLPRHPALGAYSLVTVAATLFFADWVSMPRHSWLAFPAIAHLVAVLDRRRARTSTALLGVFAAAQAVLVVGSIKWGSFPP